MIDMRKYFHPANTVQRNFSASSYRKRKENKDFFASGEPPKKEKIFASAMCLWCLFYGSTYFIFCQECLHCQYCGLRKDELSSENYCGRCGNNSPDEFEPPSKRKRYISK